jgi:hypothetical protein
MFNYFGNVLLNGKKSDKNFENKVPIILKSQNTNYTNLENTDFTDLNGFHGL